MSLCEIIDDFDYANYDPLYCAIVVKLLLLNPVNLNKIDFNSNKQAIEEYNERIN